MAKPLRIFISSPGDVVPERRRAALVIEKLAKDYARFFDIKPYLWEFEPMLASGHFQDAIVPPGETDIVVLVLWARLGTPLPAPHYHGLDGRTPVTGTEWEFESALAAHRQRGVPDLLAFKKDAPPRAEYRSDADLDALRSQLRQLDAFWTRYFVDQGEFRAAFTRFSDLDAFEAKLENDLRRLIERRIAAREGSTDKPIAATWLKGSPFRGLETYRFEHAPIFFGRSEASKSAVEHLLENAEGERPFLLVLGASGTGKSSLAQAGIVPALGVRGVAQSVGAWRRAVMRPGGHPGGPFMALASALAGDDALPELLSGQNISALARHLEAAAADPGFPIVSALAARVQAARQKGELLAHEEVRLIVVIDQLEELFTLAELTPEQRKIFVLCLKGLMDGGRVFVLATMRSDYWHRGAEVPLLVTLAEGRGRLDLLPPTQAEIAVMISRPAEVAGLRFEHEPRTEIGLDVALAEEAAREPGALPLLSFLLDALYATDVQGGKGSILRYASMRALGGLKGAIAIRAEAAFGALPAESQAALPKVLRALVTVSRSGAEPTARPIPMARFADGSAEHHVVEAFLDPQVRLLVADGDGSGARIRLAHEALITHWDRARRQIAQDRDDLRTRAMVEQAEAEWHAAGPGEKRGYLLRDPQLANAVDLTSRWSGDLDRSTLDFVDASQRRARLRQRTAFAAAAVFAVIAGTASVLGVMAYRAEQRTEVQRGVAEQQRAIAVGQTALAREQQAIAEKEAKRAEEQRSAAEEQRKIAEREAARAEEQRAAAAREQARAEEQRKVAETERMRAEAQRNEALIIQSRFLADRSEQKFKAGDSVTAALLALEALPDTQAAIVRPYVPDAERRLDSAWRHQYPGLMPREARVLAGHDNAIQACAISPDGETIVTGDNDGAARLWSLVTGKEIKQLSHDDAISKVLFRKGGKLIVTQTGSSLYVWDTESFQQLSTIGDVPESYSVSPDASRILTVEKTVVKILAREGGKVLHTFNRGRVLGHRFGPEGPRVVVAESANSVALYDPSSNALLVRFQLPRAGSATFEGASFSPDGRRLAIVNNSFTVSFFDIATKRLIKSMQSSEQVNLEGVGSVVFFSADGKRAVIPATQSFELYDIEGGEVLANVQIDDGLLGSVSLSSDGSYVVTAAALLGDSENPNTAKIWDGANGTPIITLNHIGDVACTDVSADNRRILTTSFDRIVRIWELDAKGAPSGKSYELRGKHDEDVELLDFSPDGRRLLVIARHDTRIWDVESGALVSVLKGHRGVVLMAHFDSTGARVFTRGYDNTARIWDTESGRQLHLLSGHAARILDGGFTNNDRHVVTVGDDQALRLWDAESGQLIRVDNFAPGSLKVLSDERKYGRRVLIHRPDGVLELRDPLTGQVVRELDMPRGDISFFSPFFAVSRDWTLYLWNEETGAPAGTVSLAETKFHSAKVSDDGKRLVTTHRVGHGNETGIIRTWDTSTGTKLSEIDSGHTRSFATWLSQDGTRLLIADIDGSKYFDTSTGKELMSETVGRPMAAAYSKNGERIAASAIRKSDDTLRVLDARTGGTVAAILPGHEYSNVVAYSPDGMRFATAVGYGVFIWRIAPDTQALIDLMKAYVPRCLSSAQRDEAFLSPAPPDWCVEREKWPYHTKDWKDWLDFKRANADPPLPETSEWESWVAARKPAN